MGSAKRVIIASIVTFVLVACGSTPPPTPARGPAISTAAPKLSATPSPDVSGPKALKELLLLGAGSPASTQKALDSHGVKYDTATREQVVQSNYRLSDYGVVMTSMYWTKETTRILNDNASEIKSFVNNGGVFIAFQGDNSACDFQYFTKNWSPYSIGVEAFPSDRSCEGGGSSEEAVIEDGARDHPLFKGFKNTALTTTNPVGFAGLGNEWTVLARSDKSRKPMIAEAMYGKGLYIAVQLRLASKYNEVYNYTLLFDNLVDYALQRKPDAQKNSSPSASFTSGLPDGLRGDAKAQRVYAEAQAILGSENLSRAEKQDKLRVLQRNHGEEFVTTVVRYVPVYDEKTKKVSTFDNYMRDHAQDAKRQYGAGGVGDAPIDKDPVGAGMSIFFNPSQENIKKNLGLK